MLLVSLPDPVLLCCVSVCARRGHWGDVQSFFLRTGGELWLPHHSGVCRCCSVPNLPGESANSVRVIFEDGMLMRALVYTMYVCTLSLLHM